VYTVVIFVLSIEKLGKILLSTINYKLISRVALILATVTVEQRYCRPTTINDNPIIASDASNKITDAEGDV
jgi:hypothetical protein